MTNQIKLRPMSPRVIDGQMEALIRVLGLQQERPRLLPYTEPTGFQPAPAHCHWNAWEQSATEGGGIQPGWMLFQDKRAKFAEAIFHAVWIATDGKLRDITPRQDWEELVLFVPDPTRHITLDEYEGRPAIWTYSNAKMQGSRVLAQPERFKAVLMDGYTEAIGLFPWPEQAGAAESIGSA